MVDLVEMSAKIVLEHSTKDMTSDEIVSQIQKVYSSLKAMEQTTETSTPAKPEAQSEGEEYITVEEAFGKKEIKCLVCGHGGMKVLKQHLTREHHMTPEQYRSQFGLPKHLPLVSNEYHEQRRASALARGLGHRPRTPQKPTSPQKLTLGAAAGFVIRKKQLMHK